MNFGLLKHRPSRKDYDHKKTFGAFPVDQLPDEYLLVSTILDQGASYACTAFASCAIAESRYGKQFDPNQFFYDEGVVSGRQNPTGYDMRVAMQTGIDMGFFPLGGGERVKEGSYFNINDPWNSLSLADDIRVAMWLARDEKRCASLGTMWYEEWTNSPRGIIQKGYKTKSGLHDIKCAGWTYKDSNGAFISEDRKLHLVIQNSYNSSHGDNGLYYFPMDIASNEFIEGSYIWRTKEAEIQVLGLIKSLLQEVVLLYKRLLNNLNIKWNN